MTSNTVHASIRKSSLIIDSSFCLNSFYSWRSDMWSSHCRTDYCGMPNAQSDTFTGGTSDPTRLQGELAGPGRAGPKTQQTIWLHRQLTVLRDSNEGIPPVMGTGKSYQQWDAEPIGYSAWWLTCHHIDGLLSRFGVLFFFAVNVLSEALVGSISLEIPGKTNLIHH